MDRSSSPPGLTTPFRTWSEVSVKTPNFLKLRKSGQRLPINSYYWRRVDQVTSGYECGEPLGSPRRTTGFDPTYEWMTTGTLTYPGLDPFGKCDTIQDEIAMSQNRLLAKVRNTSIDLGVSLGERRQTADFVKSAIVKTYKSLRLLKRGKVSEALKVVTGLPNKDIKDIIKASANTQLAYVYGLTPLLNDVFSACTLLEKGYKAKVEPIRVKTSKDFRFVGNKKVIGFAGRTTDFQYAIAGRSSGQIRFYVENPLFKTLDELGVLNPLSVAWELVPLSFVVDWFLPVGKFIESIVPPQGVSFVDGYMSSTMSGVVTVTSFEPISSNRCPSGCDCIETTSTVVKQRSLLSNFPRYTFVVPDLSLSNQKIGSALALLSQFFTGKK